MKDGPQVQEDAWGGCIAVCCGGFKGGGAAATRNFAVAALVDHVKTVHGMNMLPGNALVVKVDR